MPSAFGGQSQQRWGDNTLNKQEYMRDVQLIDTGGKVCSTGDARRKGMLVLAFLRTTDPLSLTLLQQLQKLADAYKESGKLTVWAVSENDDKTTLAFGEMATVSIPLLLDRDAYHAMAYGITIFPTVFFADGAGVIQQKIVGVNERAMQKISSKVAAIAGVDEVELFRPPIVAPSADAIPADAAA